MKVLFIAPLPPPVHGSAMVSQYIKDSRVVNEAFDCDFVNLSTSRSMEEIGKGGIKKLFRFLASYLIVLWKLITHRYSLCYLAITCHGMGFLKDAPFVLLCKLFCRKVVLHQHNKGLSRDVARWPYRWLMPLVYRNTTVMLLSWHLYEDVSSVVKRGQVVVCANGVPPLDNGQQSTDNGLLRDQDTQSVYDNVNENDNVDDDCIVSQQTTDNSQLSTDGLFNQHDKHTNLDTNSRNLHDAAPVRLRDETSNLTQKSQNTQKNIVSQDKQSTLDENSQNLQVAELNVETKFAGRREKQCLMFNEGSQRLNVEEDEDENLSQSDFHRSEASLTSTAGAPRLLFLSNLIESKGIYVLLEACRMLKEEGVAFQCDYVGGESKMVSGESFRAAIAAQGLADCVTYHGPQYGAAKERFFREADIFVFPTFYDNECFPLVLVEAMQHKLPVISTMEGAIPDIVTDGVNGFVCAQRDVQALAEALRRLIGDGQMRVAMGQRGYEMYREGMTLEAFEKRFTQALRSILNSQD